MKAIRVKLLLFVTVFFALAGCSRIQGLDQNGIIIEFEDSSVSKSEILPLFYAMSALEEETYASMFGSEFWKQPYPYANNDEAVFEDYFKNQVFYESLMQILILAEKYNNNHILSSEETKKCEELAAEFLEKSGCDTFSQEDVANFLCNYRASCLYRTQVQSQMNSEVSEEEARVVKVLEISFDTEKEAIEFYDQIKAENDFNSALAKNTTGKKTEYKYSRTSDIDSDFIDQIFSMKKGDYSSILTVNEKFVILYLEESLLKEESEKNKQEIIEDRLYTTLKNEVNDYLYQNKVSINKTLWNSLKIDENNRKTSSVLFDFMKELE